ncbi:MAG: sirohydrochlorin chelatase [Verrucomicrobiota bacterium JB025]|nr:CbiX/SirB N-terminal domain-containing protein [Verrucomicrobiota bacterium JB025]
MISRILSCGFALALLAGCSRQDSTSGSSLTSDGGKIGVLLVSHGSHSENWRKMLFDVEHRVRDEVLADANIAGIESAFMEYTEPSIATRLKEFDAGGYSDVIIVPVLLTVSGHSFDDIPVIAGQREDPATAAHLKLEKIETYKPRANVTLTPLLDFPDVLRKNVIRRAARMSREPEDEGLVLVAYGSEAYHDEWKALMDEIGQAATSELGLARSRHAWCGHIARYKPEPTEQAIREILREQERALVVPVLVAVDETFQGRIIGGAIENVNQPERIEYRHDAVLPDENVDRWVVEASREHAARIAGGEAVAKVAAEQLETEGSEAAE